MLLLLDGWCEGKLFNRNIIKKISIVNTFKKGNLFSSWDISEQHDGSITAHLLNGEKELVVAGNGNGKIQAGSSMRRMFAEFTSLEKIDGLDILDTSNVTDMSYLFYHCTSLEEIDLSGWDVSNVQSFRGTFCCGHNQIGDAKLKKINLSGWDVSGATDMAYMFYGCGQLKYIDVSDWNTSNVKNFRHTFADCFQLQEIDVSRWNTENVITLDGIFNDCRSLKHIDISGWNTSNCQEFDQLFDNCTSLKRIDGIEKLDTSNGISFEEMFFGCRSLKSLNLSSLNTRNVDGHTFTAYCSSIQSTSNMKKMLVGCNNLKKLIIGSNLLFSYSNTEESIIIKKLNGVGYLVLSPETGSMKPFLHPKKDHAVFRRKDCYRRNDIVLYRSINEDKLVMHRIIRPLADGFLVCGDHSLFSEYVPMDNVFAAATEVYQNGKSFKRGSIKYRVNSLLSIYYNRLRFEYKKNNGIFWKAARKLRGILSNV